MVREGLASSGNSVKKGLIMHEKNKDYSILVTYILLKAILYGCVILLIGGLTMEVYYSI